MPRPMILSMSGWYPSSKTACLKEIVKFNDTNFNIENDDFVSAIVPHAGWYFCGKLSVNTIRILKENNSKVKNVFVFGGHLSQFDLPVIETFDFAETPFGNLKNNSEVIDLLKNENIEKEEYIHDNTIEILFPIVKYYFGDVNITAIYLPSNKETISLVELIYSNSSKDSVFIGSTDLTHYGPNYGFYHDDKTISDIDWVKKINDKNYIDLLISMKDLESLEYALKNHSACSAGASLGAMTCAKKKGAKNGKLIGYNTSYDLHKDKSFVGYAGIVY